MDECKLVQIPITPRITLSLSYNSQLVDAIAYKQLIGSLLYLTISRLDIIFSMNLMAHLMQKLYVEHFNVFKQILRHVAGTTDLALKYDKFSSFFLLGFSYSNYGGDRDDRKSTSTYVSSIGLGAISWISKK